MDCHGLVVYRIENFVFGVTSMTAKKPHVKYSELGSR